MHWLGYFIVNVALSVLCYLTNWIVTMLADERGELKGFLHYWQTWDDSLDVDWFVKETVPSIFRYDFDKHYVPSRERTKRLEPYNRDKGCVICIDDNFTLRERLQRYFCRTLWLYRNNCYGFAFYVLGEDHIGSELKRAWGYNWELYHSGKWFGPWMLKAYVWRFQILAGWKLDVESTVLKRSMIAGRIIFR